MMLALVAIGSIAVLSYVAYSTSKDALTHSVFEHLTSVRASKKYQIESQFEFLRNQASNLADDTMMVDLMKGLRAGFAEKKDAPIPPEWSAAITAYYRDDFLPKLARNVEEKPILESYLPRSPASQYFQYFYIAANPNPTGEKYRLNDAGDGSHFSAVHKIYQPIIVQLVLQFGFDNLMLIDSDSGDVVYTFGKSPVFGTNCVTGCYADSLRGLYESLAHSREKNAVKIVDFRHFAPSQGNPVAIVAAPIFDGLAQIGILALQLPVSEINRVMTGDRGWVREGLGQTGETYLVGPDHLMRSEARRLIDDRAGYFNQLQQAGFSAGDMGSVVLTGTAILGQSVHTRAVEEALTGKEGTTVLKNALGVPALTSYAPLNIPGLRWVIIAEQSEQEAFAPLNRLSYTILASTVVILGCILVVATYLARAFVRPISKLMQGVRKLQAGQTSATVELTSDDEFSHLAAAFNTMTGNLHSATEHMEQEKRQNEQLLLNIMPPSAGRRFRAGDEQIVEEFAHLCVLFAELDGYGELISSLAAQRALEEMNEIIGLIDEAAEQHGVLKIKAAGPGYLATAGMEERSCDAPEEHILEFAAEILQRIERLNRERQIRLRVRIGVDQGRVIGATMGQMKLTYDIWGEVVDSAREIVRYCPQNAILTTGSVRDRVLADYEFDTPIRVTRQSGREIIAWPVRARVASQTSA